MNKLLDYQNWEDYSEELKDYYLMLYGEIYVYKNKIVPYNILDNYLKAWFRDEILHI